MEIDDELFGAAVKDFDDLRRSIPDKSKYSRLHRSQDFKSVFMNSPEGLRVLSQIMEMGFVFSSSVIQDKNISNPLDLNRVVLHEGARQLALQICSFATADIQEPKDRPDQTQKSKKGD
jgi:hypothetical protein